MLFQWELSGQSPSEVAEVYWAGVNATKETRAFANQLFTAAVQNQDQIDALIRQHSEHWRIQRMAAVDRNVLRMGIAELLAFPQTDAAVVIDEALEIAKRFSSPDSFQFINGVLDAVRKGLPRQ
jgi:N utilization substance protein B